MYESSMYVQAKVDHSGEKAQQDTHSFKTSGIPEAKHLKLTKGQYFSFSI